MDYWTYLNLDVMFLIVYFKQNINLKIQKLAGKEAKTYFEIFFKNLISLHKSSAKIFSSTRIHH